MDEVKLEELAAFYDTHDVSDAIDTGRAVVPEPMVTTSLRLPSRVVEALKAEANDRGIRYTQLIRDLVTRHVGESGASTQSAAGLASFLQEISHRLSRLEARTERLLEVAPAGTGCGRNGRTQDTSEDSLGLLD